LLKQAKKKKKKKKKKIVFKNCVMDCLFACDSCCVVLVNCCLTSVRSIEKSCSRSHNQDEGSTNCGQSWKSHCGGGSVHQQGHVSLCRSQWCFHRNVSKAQ
jgi:hypothetical protein